MASMRAWNRPWPRFMASTQMAAMMNQIAMRRTANTTKKVTAWGKKRRR